MSLSSLTSWTLGGGSAIARPINPITEEGFRLGDSSGDNLLSFPISKTTWKILKNYNHYNYAMPFMLNF